jgi:hypothetical protein
MGPELPLYVALGLLVLSLVVGTWMLPRSARAGY